MDFTHFKLDPVLSKAVKKAGYTKATPIQEKAIPSAMAGHDLIGTAQTGTGKTAAFVLPILHRLLSGPRKKVRALIVTPTRELAAQINDTINELGADTNINSIPVYGGVGAGPQINALKNGVEILVACPGRLLDLVQQKHARLGTVEVLILDEGDRMFDMGFLPDVRRILKYVPNRKQTMLFSATFPPDVEQLASQALTKPKRIAVGISRPAHTVAHALYPVKQHLKSRLLMQILEITDTGPVLIFTRTKHRAKRLAHVIERTGRKVTSLHSNRTQGQRQTALNGFKNGDFQIMVATDIAARGLDVENISHVINFDMPDTADAYIHRIGRTGRAQRTGDAFTLVTEDDTVMVRTLEKILGNSLPVKKLEAFDYHAAAPPRQPQRPSRPRPLAAKQKRQGPKHRPGPQKNRPRSKPPKTNSGLKVIEL